MTEENVFPSCWFCNASTRTHDIYGVYILNRTVYGCEKHKERVIEMQTPKITVDKIAKREGKVPA